MRPASLVFLVVIIGCISAVMIMDARQRLARARPALPDMRRPVHESPIQSPSPQEWPPPAAEPRVAPPPDVPLPPVETDPRRARPLIDVTSQRRADMPRLERVLRRFYPVPADRPDAALRVVMRVASDGRVVDARAEQSSFRNPEFEVALIDEVKRIKYPDDDRYRTTEFIFEYRSVKPLPQRPIAEIETERESLQARIQRRRETIFAGAPVPANARIRIIYRVSPRGTVDEARVEASSFHSVAFERAVIQEIRKLRFAANPGYAPTEYAFEYAIESP